MPKEQQHPQQPIILDKEPTNRLYPDSCLSSSSEFACSSFSKISDAALSVKSKQTSKTQSLSQSNLNQSSQSETSNLSNNSCYSSSGQDEENEEFLILSKPAYDQSTRCISPKLSSIGQQKYEYSSSTSISHRGINQNKLNNQNNYSRPNLICCVCKKPITNQDIIKNGDMTPYPEKVHGHCWLHIINKNCPIPWPRNLPREHSQRHQNKSEQLPTIRKIQKFYNFVTTGVWEVPGEASASRRNVVEKIGSDGKGFV